MGKLMLNGRNYSGGNGAGSSSGAFPDISNVIASGTHTGGMTYTATQDCFFSGQVGGNNSNGAWFKIDGSHVAGGYMSLSQYEYRMLLPLKQGQTIELVSPLNQSYTYTVYGLI